MAKPLRLVVLGMMGRCPFAGQTWLYLNWLSGLHRLGHEVWYVEDDSVWPYHPDQDRVTGDCSYAVRHISRCLGRIGLEGRWAFRLVDREGVEVECHGLNGGELDRLYGSCDALLNIGGATGLREVHDRAPLKVYVETDPVVVELRLAAGDAWDPLAEHDAVVTYGENYGNPDCGVPLNGHRFLKTRQPVDLDLWPAAIDRDAPYFTTVANYRQEGFDVEHDGEVYTWSKHHQWERFIVLPKLTEQPFELAMKADEPDLEHLRAHGWRLAPPLPMTLDIFDAYPAFIRRSRAEFTVAKDQNVRLRSGWFSERDACYLASGKPVVAQDTGFGCALPTGEGLLAVSTVDAAADAVETINGDYARHAEAARAIAEEYLEARGVARRMLADVGLV